MKDSPALWSGNMSLISHWGQFIDTEVPTTGVIGCNDAMWLMERFTYHGIDLDFEEYIAAGGDPDEYEAQEPTMLLGFKKDAEGLYEVDENAEISAILRGSTIQIVRSDYVAKGTPCSPCFPGQCTIDPQGECLCYAPAPDFYDEDVPEVFLFKRELPKSDSTEV